MGENRKGDPQAERQRSSFCGPVVSYWSEELVQLRPLDGHKKEMAFGLIGDLTAPPFSLTLPSSMGEPIGLYSNIWGNPDKLVSTQRTRERHFTFSLLFCLIKLH